ncbi:hypothetical protein KZ810_07165 [Sphingomonas sp. RHCKR47]|uniref:hypothetical protein n=1 Tax=Sphingomonas citricola TaxID=2862498 RepID=UPI001CA4AE7C|nr:hypothetical protein [Sphingomonas citricola]MBW6523277.1 hypothetical protein [Sphingomonas citricola]
MRAWSSPTSIIWLVVHLFLVLSGMLLMTTEGEKLLGATLAQSLGSGLLATGIAGMVLYLYVRMSEQTQNRLEVITAAGITGVFRHRSVRIKEHYDKRLHSAKRIDLIGLGLSSFREDYARDFAEWSRKAKVRILVLDPDFPNRAHSLADYRDLEEGGAKGEIRADVVAFLRAVEDNAEIDRTRFEVRKMRSIPAINLLRIDDEIFWGPYLMAERSRNTPTLLVRGGFMFDNLVQHYDETWKAAAPNAAA